MTGERLEGQSNGFFVTLELMCRQTPPGGDPVPDGRQRLGGRDHGGQLQRYGLLFGRKTGNPTRQHRVLRVLLQLHVHRTGEVLVPDWLSLGFQNEFLPNRR